MADLVVASTNIFSSFVIQKIRKLSIENTVATANLAFFHWGNISYRAQSESDILGDSIHFLTIVFSGQPNMILGSDFRAQRFD